MRTIICVCIVSICTLCGAEPKDDFDRLFTGSNEINRHALFLVKEVPEWVPQPQRQEIVKQLSETSPRRFYACKETGAIVERMEKGTARFLVVPSHWKGIALVEMTEANAKEDWAPPINTIQALLNSPQVVMGRLMVEIRANDIQVDGVMGSK